MAGIIALLTANQRKRRDRERNVRDSFPNDCALLGSWYPLGNTQALLILKEIRNLQSNLPLKWLHEFRVGGWRSDAEIKKLFTDM